jgi:hypothetical protein
MRLERGFYAYIHAYTHTNTAARRREALAARPARIAYNNYRALGGDGCAIGDGVIPLSCAHLDGARQVTLEGVLHSMSDVATQWYGSDEVVDRWLGPALAELK